MWYKSYSYNLQKGLFSLKVWWFDLQFGYNSFFDILLENNAENSRNKKNLVSNLWCLHSSDAFKISQNTSSEQNLQEHGENLGSKLTNHKIKSFLRGPRLICFLCRKLCVFYFNVIGSFIKKVWHPLFSINMFIGSFFFTLIRFK